MCKGLLGCGLWVVTGELRRDCSLAAGASACTPCIAGSYFNSTGARPHLRVRERAVPPAICTWVCVLFMYAPSCFAGKHEAECDNTRNRGRTLQVRGSACSSAKVHLWQTRVSCCEWMSGGGCITTGNSNMRNMSADEPHEGSGG